MNVVVIKKKHKKIRRDMRLPMLFFVTSFFQFHIFLNAQLANLIALTPEEEHLALNYSFDELFSIGRKYKVSGEVEEAMHYLKAALLKRPMDWAANWDLGDLYLAKGDFKLGMAGFKFRWQHEKQFHQKLWRGEDISDKKILVYCQWGLGDTFMYIRYAAELKKRGAFVICQVQSPLVQILKYCPYIDQLISMRANQPDFDFQVPTAYFPEVFETTIDSIPSEIPYIYVQPTHIETWAKKLGEKKKFRIGIFWQGAIREDPQTSGRAMKLTDFLPIFNIENVEMYSLQEGYGAEQIQQLSAHDRKKLHVFDAEFDKGNGSFVDTAAVMKNLDLVLTIDTSVAHLAGALGVPTWVMLQYASEWRFFLVRSDSPWYPSMRLFRQPSLGDWHSVVQEVMSELQKITH
jgi:hypothetical protein